MSKSQQVLVDFSDIENIMGVMKKLTKHDNVDRDIIIINKDSLLLRLFRAKEFFNSINSFWGFLGVAITLLLGGYLTEKFHDVGSMPGETVRAVFISLGIISMLFAMRSLILWFRLRKTHEPAQIVASLMKNQSDASSKKAKTKKKPFWEKIKARFSR